MSLPQGEQASHEEHCIAQRVGYFVDNNKKRSCPLSTLTEKALVLTRKCGASPGEVGGTPPGRFPQAPVTCHSRRRGRPLPLSSHILRGSASSRRVSVATAHSQGQGRVAQIFRTKKTNVCCGTRTGEEAAAGTHTPSGRPRAFPTTRSSNFLRAQLSLGPP